jgi:hypothetical protein
VSHNIDETYSFYEEKYPRARLAHECDACGDAIAPGHIYARVSWHFDGKTESVKRCLRCQKLHLHLRGLGCGETWPAERLDCGEEYEEHWGGEAPPEIQQLAFVTGADLQPETEPAE